MKLLKKINNNYALALDSKGKQVIVEGKGIGFQKMPCNIEDLSLISKTYYNVQNQSISLIQSISEDVLKISSDICTYAEQKISVKINPNITFILADHIEFALERIKKNIIFKMPFYYDLKQLFPIEMEISSHAVNLINNEFGVMLPETEITLIALNIINSEIDLGDKHTDNNQLIAQISNYIEKYFNIVIDINSFSYSRFISHLEYLFKRCKDYKKSSKDNIKLYLNIKNDLQQVSKCVDNIQILLSDYGYYLNEEEKLYLIIHINRLCTRSNINENI